MLLRGLSEAERWVPLAQHLPCQRLRQLSCSWARTSLLYSTRTWQISMHANVASLALCIIGHRCSTAHQSRKATVPVNTKACTPMLFPDSTLTAWHCTCLQAPVRW